MTISLTDIEDSEEGSGPGQLMVDMECPNCKVIDFMMGVVGFCYI